MGILVDDFLPMEGSWFRGCHDGDSWRSVAPAQIAFLGANLVATAPRSPGP